MKKIIIIIIFLICINVHASTNIDLNNKELEESFINIKKNYIKDVIIIPKDFNEDEIIIESNIFDCINHYRLLKKNNYVEVELVINNMSDNDYEYIIDSLYITRKEKKVILYRTNNKALKVLNIDLTDEDIDNKLKTIGYSGIEELDKYYKDYYKNNIKKIFSGKITSNIETNKNIIELSKDYYFNNILQISLNNKKYSIDECTNYYIDDTNFKNNLGLIENNKMSNSVKYKIMYSRNYKELFKNYLTGKLEFTIKKT